MLDRHHPKVVSDPTYSRRRKGSELISAVPTGSTAGHVFVTGLALLLTRSRGNQVSSIANSISRTTTTWLQRSNGLATRLRGNTATPDSSNLVVSGHQFTDQCAIPES